eukprot:TRINITY_DN35195_c0_g1_i1.p2 TRINITY_DN35195_c0_g1~~TRINITY_DN35195_c0_g1_i1.p2  ORF type:complete len:222 (-),score=62.48 TRINITY_DN35195_c0_g1_i1:135-800(-)
MRLQSALLLSVLIAASGDGFFLPKNATPREHEIENDEATAQTPLAEDNSTKEVVNSADDVPERVSAHLKKLEQQEERRDERKEETEKAKETKEEKTEESEKAEEYSTNILFAVLALAALARCVWQKIHPSSLPFRETSLVLASTPRGGSLQQPLNEKPRMMGSADSSGSSRKSSKPPFGDIVSIGSKVSVGSNLSASSGSSKPKTLNSASNAILANKQPRR